MSWSHHKHMDLLVFNLNILLLYKSNHQGPPLGYHQVHLKILHCVQTVVQNVDHLPFTTPTFTLKMDGHIYMGPYSNPNCKLTRHFRILQCRFLHGHSDKVKVSGDHVFMISIMKYNIKLLCFYRCEDHTGWSHLVSSSCPPSRRTPSKILF